MISGISGFGQLVLSLHCSILADNELIAMGLIFDGCPGGFDFLKRLNRWRSFVLIADLPQF